MQNDGLPTMDYATSYTRRRWGPWIIVGGIVSLLVALSLFIPTLNRPGYGPSPRLKCHSNMMQIGQAILLYSYDNRNEYPPDLATTWATQDLYAAVFICLLGNSSSSRAATQFTSDPAARAANNLDYIYVGEVLTNRVTAEEPVLFERLSDHDHDGGNVLFGDGHVEFIDKKQILKLLEPLRGTPRLTEEEYDAILAK